MIKKRVQHRTSTEGSALGRSLLRGLQQAVAYERGELKGRVEVYDDARRQRAENPREGRSISSGFSNRYGFNRRSLQDWEQGRRMPDSAARAYLIVIANNPAAVHKALLQRAS